MGYTHYWRYQNPIAPEAWERICTALRNIIAKSKKPIIQREFDDDSAPTISDSHIIFNGIGENGHETFYLVREGGSDFEFCKTARKPYDMVVTAVLILVATYAPCSYSISSDGDSNDWEEGMKLAKFITGNANLVLPPNVRPIVPEIVG